MAELSVQKKAQGPKSGILPSVVNLTTWINWTIWIPPLHHIIMKMNEHVKGVHLSTSSSSPLIFYAAASFRHSPDISHGPRPVAPARSKRRMNERTNERTNGNACKLNRRNGRCHRQPCSKLVILTQVSIFCPKKLHQKHLLPGLFCGPIWLKMGNLASYYVPGPIPGCRTGYGIERAMFCPS